MMMMILLNSSDWKMAGAWVCGKVVYQNPVEDLTELGLSPLYQEKSGYALFWMMVMLTCGKTPLPFVVGVSKSRDTAMMAYSKGVQKDPNE